MTTNSLDLLGANMFAYCENNPVNMNDPDGNLPQWLKKTVSFIKSGISRLSKTLSSNTNHVSRMHTRTPTCELDLGPLIGNVGFSATETTQDKSPAKIYSFSDIGNDAEKAGIGVAPIKWLGVEVGGSNELNVYLKGQVTPWVHGEISLGLDGVGLSIGVDNKNTSVDFEIKAGLLTIAVLVASEMIGPFFAFA